MILDVQDVVFSYQSRTVLNAVRFSVAQGELLTILGPNGVGKTTLLKCINSIHAPRSGAVMVEGCNVFRLSLTEIAQRIGYVAQKSEPARLTVFDAVLMGRKPHIRWNVSNADIKKVDAVIDRLNLSPVALRHLDELSGGELQKVCIARALVQEPRLLLLDEPTSSLDLKNQVEIMNLLRHVVDEHNIAVVMTMHDLNTALRYADKALFLHQGDIYAAMPVSDISADIIQDVYGIGVDVLAINGHPVVVPASPHASNTHHRRAWHEHTHHHD